MFLLFMMRTRVSFSYEKKLSILALTIDKTPKPLPSLIGMPLFTALIEKIITRRTIFQNTLLQAHLLGSIKITPKQITPKHEMFHILLPPRTISFL